VTQLDGLELAGRGAGGHRGTTERAVVQDDLDLDGRVAPGVQDFAGGDVVDDGHGRLLGLGSWGAGSSRASLAPRFATPMRPRARRTWESEPTHSRRTDMTVHSDGPGNGLEAVRRAGIETTGIEI